MSTYTEYRLASAADKRAIEIQTAPGVPLFDPIVVAMRGRRVVGYLATQESKNTVDVGPLWVADVGHRGFICHKLVAVYDTVLRVAGVRMYRFMVDHENTRWISLLRDLDGFEVEQVAPEGTVFRRWLYEQKENSPGSADVRGGAGGLPGTS